MDGTPPKLWAVVYEHRHGLDASFYSSEENAYIGACCIIIDWIHEVHDEEIRGNLKQMFLNEQYQAMLQVWGEYQMECGSETLTIDEASEIDSGLRKLESHRAKAAGTEATDDK